MTTKVYCYHCMTYHHPDAMRKIPTRSGERWRCIRSIEAARGSPDARDAFGERQSESNRLKAQHLQNIAVRERQTLGGRL